MKKYIGRKFSYKGETFTVVDEYANIITLSTHQVMRVEVFEQRVLKGIYKEVVK